MRLNSSRNRGASQIEIEFTDKPITPYGGMALIMRFFEKLKVKRVLQHVFPDERTSPNATEVIDIAVSFMASVLCGATRFAHVERIRNDRALSAILGVDSVPSASTFTRYFNTFTHGQVELLSQRLWKWTQKRFPHKPQACTLDLDSSVFTRYGEQEGARKGYNPRKPGRPSHRPIFAFLAELKIVVNLWLRSGNVADLSGLDQFLDETLAKMPARIKVKAVRADSGFHAQSAFEYFEHRKLRYAIYVRMDSRIQRTIAALEDWRPIKDDPHREIAELEYQSLNWKRPRRMVVVRERVRPGRDNRGKMLFDIIDYTYTAVITNMDDAAIEVWRFYNKRADCENRIKELKEDFGADGFCLDSFFGTEAALRIVAFCYNLITLFRVAVLKNTSPTLKTIRYQVIVVGAQMGSRARKKKLRISARGRLRKNLKILLNRIDEIDQASLRCSWAGK